MKLIAIGVTKKLNKKVIIEDINLELENGVVY